MEGQNASGRNRDVVRLGILLGLAFVIEGDLCHYLVWATYKKETSIATRRNQPIPRYRVTRSLSEIEPDKLIDCMEMALYNDYLRSLFDLRVEWSIAKTELEERTS